MENTAPRPLYPRERDQVPVLYEVGLVFGFDCRVVKDFSPIGIRSPDHPTPSESPNRLRYPGPLNPDMQIIPYWIKSTCSFLPSHGLCAADIVFNRRFITAKAGVPFQARHCDTCGGQSGNGTGIFASASSFPFQYYSTIAPHSFNHMPPRYGGQYIATDITESSTQ